MVSFNERKTLSKNSPNEVNLISQTSETLRNSANIEKPNKIEEPTIQNRPENRSISARTGEILIEKNISNPMEAVFNVPVLLNSREESLGTQAKIGNVAQRLRVRLAMTDAPAFNPEEASQASPLGLTFSRCGIDRDPAKGLATMSIVLGSNLVKPLTLTMQPLHSLVEGLLISLESNQILLSLIDNAPYRFFDSARHQR